MRTALVNAPRAPFKKEAITSLPPLGPGGLNRGQRKERVASSAAPGAKGFTLLELVVVLALLSLLMGLVVPGMYGTWKRERERATLRQLMTTLRMARSAAATRHRRVRVFLDLGSGYYRLEGGAQTGQLSRGFRLGEAHLVWENQEARKGYIAFYGDGSSSGGYLALVDERGQRQLLNVEIVTGRVSLKAGGP